MTGKTHLAAGLVIGLLSCQHTNLSPENAVALCASAAIASLVPDIDRCTSKLGRVVAPASFLIQLVFGHRTLFHSPLLYLVAAGVAYWLRPEWILLISGSLLGVSSHLLLDMLNPAGIPLLYPAKRRFGLGICRSGGLIDHLLFAAFSIAAAYLMARYLGF